MVCPYGLESTIVAPLVGAWIETAMVASQSDNNASRLSWARGLKPRYVWDLLLTNASRLSWARGLKLPALIKLSMNKVAPLVGAWIETILSK